MKFLNIVERLQKSEEGKDKIIIVRCGAFFVGVGKDAVILSTLLGLRTTCMKIGVCKVGIPINAMLKYIDELERIGHSFLKPIYIPQFIENTYACIEKRGMHKACLDLQNMMKHCKRIWGNYYILKMDVRKFFDSINKNILLQILERKIKDADIIWLIKEILFVQSKDVGIEIREL